jgi:hypothetical protein
VALGLALLLAWRVRWLFLATLALMLAFTASVSLNSPQVLAAAFNPLTLNVAVMALALVGFISSADLPSAGRCLRKRPEREP